MNAAISRLALGAAATVCAMAVPGIPPRAAAAEAPRVQLLRTPGGGIQPQTVVDSEGTVHLIYYKGDSASGDIFYVRRSPGEKVFSSPIQVNSGRGSAIAIGTIRGAQLAVGRNGRAHVAWNGHAPKGGAWREAPMLYTRLNDAGSGFEPERDVITRARGLDGGGSVAADSRGNVYVFWHAPTPGKTNGEAGRALFVARSADDGKTFGPERPAISRQTGACGCCGMKAFADSHGNLLALYRAASEKVNRDQVLLMSRDSAAGFKIAFTHPWEIAACPMSSASFSETREGVLAAWETEGDVYLARVHPQTWKVSKPVSPPGAGKRKHPVAVSNARGETLLAWTEGTGWAKGGAVAWQVYDPAGEPTSAKGRADGVPVWSLVSAFPGPDGGFVIVY